MVIIFDLLLNFSYASAAWRLIRDSGIILNCFLSVIGTEEQEGSIKEQQLHPNKPINFLLFMLYIYYVMILNNKLLIAIFILIIIFIISSSYS